MPGLNGDGDTSDTDLTVARAHAAAGFGSGMGLSLGLGMIPVSAAGGTMTAVLPISGPGRLRGHGREHFRSRVKTGAGTSGTGRTRGRVGSKGKAGSRVGAREKERALRGMDIDGEVEDSALLAQRLLRRLQGAGSGSGGGGGVER